MPGGETGTYIPACGAGAAYSTGGPGGGASPPNKPPRKPRSAAAATVTPATLAAVMLKAAVSVRRNAFIGATLWRLANLGIDQQQRQRNSGYRIRRRSG